METVSVRFEKRFLQDMEQVMKSHRYATKTEFIREAVREKIRDLETQHALQRLERAYGSGKKDKKITDEDKIIKEMRIASGAVTPIGTRLYDVEEFAKGKVCNEEAFKEIAKKLGVE